MERVIVPSFWRDYLERPLSDRKALKTQSIFSTIFADHLIYKGIEDWQHLGDRNTEKYGLHTISDLQDFPDADSQEYHKRWVTHKIWSPYGPSLPVLEQHYGMKTIGLDVTFDPLIALFFASHEFVDLGDGKSTFVAIEKGNHRGVLYFLVYEDPQLRSTESMIKELDVFEHLPPLRPMRQKCALPGFQYNEIAASALDLDGVLFLDGDFSTEGLPKPEDIFPIHEDKFYLAS